MTGPVTRGQKHVVTESIIMAKLVVWVAEKSQWGKWLAYSQPRTLTKAIQFIYKARMKLAKILLPQSPQPVDGDYDDEEEETESKSPSIAITQDTQSGEGSQDEFDEADEDQY